MSILICCSSIGHGRMHIRNAFPEAFCKGFRKAFRKPCFANSRHSTLEVSGVRYRQDGVRKEEPQQRGTNTVARALKETQHVMLRKRC